MGRDVRQGGSPAPDKPQALSLRGVNRRSSIQCWAAPELALASRGTFGIRRGPQRVTDLPVEAHRFRVESSKKEVQMPTIQGESVFRQRLQDIAEDQSRDPFFRSG
jgi:hypothetical protein